MFLNKVLNIQKRDTCPASFNLTRILHEGMEFPGNPARKLGQNREMT